MSDNIHKILSLIVLFLTQQIDVHILVLQQRTGRLGMRAQAHPFTVHPLVGIDFEDFDGQARNSTALTSNDVHVGLRLEMNRDFTA